MLKDIQETLQIELQNPDVQREFILAYAEEEGLDGVLKALERIAEATQTAPTPPANRAKPARASRPGGQSLKAVRTRLNAVGLDLTLTAK